MDRRVTPTKLNAFGLYGQATPKEVDRALSPNSGPKIMPAPLNAFGEFTPGVGSNEIRISEKLLSDYEAGNASTKLLDATFEHELVHFFDDQDGADFPGEEGELYEQSVYGCVVNY